MSIKLASRVKYIPKGLADGYDPVAEVGVRLTPGDCAAHIELTQFDSDGECQEIELTLSQMKTLHNALRAELIDQEVL